MITPDQKMWMTGGFYEGNLDSTIFVLIDGPSESGLNLPHELSNHAIVSINETLSLLIGGEDKELIVMDTTYYFSHETEKLDFVECSKHSLWRNSKVQGLCTIADD